MLPHLVQLLSPRNLFRANYSLNLLLCFPSGNTRQFALVFCSIAQLKWHNKLVFYFCLKHRGFLVPFVTSAALYFCFLLALPSVFNTAKAVISNFLLNKMPQVLIHASLVSSFSLSVLNMDHCLTLHSFSLDSLLFWCDLIHLIGLEIMTTVWFMSKPRLQGKLLELTHPNLDPRNITSASSGIAKLWT